MTQEIDLREDIGEVLLTEEQIQGKVRELGAGSATTIAAAG